MKKSVAVILSLVLIAMAVAIAYLAIQRQQLTSRIVETQLSEEIAREQFGAALQSIAEIQDSLSVMLPAEERLAHISHSAEMGGTLTQSQKEEMLDTISDLKLSVSNTKLKIEELEKSMRKSQAEVTSLNRVIENLKRSVAEREATIQRLTGEVEALKSTVAGLETDVQMGQAKIAEQQSTIDAKTRELSAIYYVIGTRDELKQKGIITVEGGFIGIGKTVRLTNTYDEADFTVIDSDQTTEIPVPFDKPEVLSRQSQASYELRLLADRQSKLVITDPVEFRKVKYVVIMVEK